MPSSGTYNFSASESKLLIEDAYRLVGITPNLLTNDQLLSAQVSCNFILSHWLNKDLNLWTVKQDMLALVPNQATYDLPEATSDVLEACIRTSTRNLGGTPYSSSGTAIYAFDGNPATACTESAPDGYIGYTWGAGNQYTITMVGVQSNDSLSYDLIFESSNDGTNWTIVSSPEAQVFPLGELVWFVVDTPIAGTYFQVREINGATLNIQELYFNTQVTDYTISRASRSEYVSYPNKNQAGRPTLFWIDRKVNPKITLWPVPNATYNNLYYTRIQFIQDVGTLRDSIEIPSRFLNPLRLDLAANLEMKKPNYDLNKFNILKSMADKTFEEAREEDNERVPIRIFTDYWQGYLQV